MVFSSQQYKITKTIPVYMFIYLYVANCFSWGFCCCDKHRDQKQVWEERVYFISHFRIIVHCWRKLVQKPGGRNRSRIHCRMQLTGSLLMACSACFLRQLRITCPRDGTAQGELGLPYQSLIKVVPQTLLQADLMETFSQFFPNLSLS